MIARPAEQPAERSAPDYTRSLNTPERRKGSLRNYQDMFIGSTGWLSLLNYELAMMFGRPTSGALGYLARQRLYRRIVHSVGPGVVWGRNVTIRHGGKMRIGAHTAIDDECLLCARGADPGGFVLGEDVLVARGSVIQIKSGFVTIGDHCKLGMFSFLGAVGGIRIGDHVMVGGQVYIGGGRHPTARTGRPMAMQGVYSKGPAALPSLSRSATPLGEWLRGLLARAHKNTVVVALASKLARIAWAVLRTGQAFQARVAAAAG